MYFAAALIASFLVSANALATPHYGQAMVRRHYHAAVAKVRAAAPDPVAQPLDATSGVPKLRKRCQPRNALSSAPAAVSPAASAPANVAVPVNAAPSLVASSMATPPPASQPSPVVSQAPPSPPPPSPSPSPAPAPAQAQPQSGSLFSGTQKGGDGTFYGTGMGACGIVNKNTDFIAAVSQDLFDIYPGNVNPKNPNTNPICKKNVTVDYQGKQVTVMITDRCVACQPKDLDFSPAAFDQLADEAIGRIHNIAWTWID